MERHIVWNRIGYLLVELWNGKERGEEGGRRGEREREEKGEGKERGKRKEGEKESTSGQKEAKMVRGGEGPPGVGMACLLK